ncbi:MAG: hypothetical protein mread185_000412 [Mycoplasmataceae bacterium]|nr:MAG: hypothetical protein mread185_000412 [Mycoplasmataceae bacterium]
MSFQETIDRLQKKQDQVVNDFANWDRFRKKWNWGYNTKEEAICWIIESLKKSYEKNFKLGD